jgi:hypothetical protein
VVCRAALLVATFPAKSVFALLDPAKNKTTVDIGGTTDRDVADGKSECVKALMVGVMKKSVVPLIKSK